jgi:hypothetical protein
MCLPPHRVSEVPYGDPTGVTYENTEATENQYGDQHLAIGSRNQLKTQTQITGGSLQEFSTAIEELTHCAFPALHEDHVHRGTGKAFIKSRRERSRKRQLLLGGERILNEVLRQTLELEVVQLAVRSSTILQKTSDRALWRSQPPSKMKEETTDILGAGAVGASVTSRSSVPIDNLT